MTEEEAGQERAEDRTVTLLGKEAYSRLRASRVLIIGLGGVGGYAAEMLARSGIGQLTLIDADKVSPSNLNRQIIALRSTLGVPKSQLFSQRIADIDPETVVSARCEYITPDNIGSILDEGFDFVVDAIDTVAPKVALIKECLERKIPVISSMGAGGRVDPSKVEITDIWSTKEDGLARAVRQRLKKAGIRKSLKVVTSTEVPRHGALLMEEGKPNKMSSLGTTAIVPSTFGIFLASHVIEKLTGQNNKV